MKIKPIVFFLFLLFILGFPLRNSLAESYDFQFQVNIDSDKDDIAPGDHVCATVDGDCSLMAAIHEANALKQSALINIPQGTYPLNNAIVSDAIVKVQGAGADRTIIKGEKSRILQVSGAQTIVTLEGIAITGGSTRYGLHGGAIKNSQSTLNIKSSKLYYNQAKTVFDVYKINNQLMIDPSADTYGGAIYNDLGNINIEDTAIYQNTSDAEVDFAGGLTEQDLSFEENIQLQTSINNSNIGRGGGIYSKNGNLIIKRSSFYGNTAASYGGAIYMANGSVLLENITFSTNYAWHGDGIFILQEGNNLAKLNVVSSTFNENIINNQENKVYYHDMVFTYGDKNLINIKLKSSLVFAKCVADVESLGYNLVVVDDNLCNITPQAGDLIGSFENPILPLLDQFDNSDGIYNLLPGSPAIDAGDPNGCTDLNGDPLLTDQRGLPRPQTAKGICDIGAVEMGCGDGFVRNAEECDDGNSNNMDNCLDTCVLATCGDGFVHKDVEACDDGNKQDGDGCSSSCQIESSTGNISTSGDSTAGDSSSSGGCSLASGEVKPSILWFMFFILTIGLARASLLRKKRI